MQKVSTLFCGCFLGRGSKKGKRNGRTSTYRRTDKGRVEAAGAQQCLAGAAAVVQPAHHQQDFPQALYRHIPVVANLQSP